MTKINSRSRRSWHKYIVMNEKANKAVDRGVDMDCPMFINWQSKHMHLSKYHGTKYRGLKRWLAKGKVTKGDKND